MAHYKARVVLPYVTGLPADEANNDFSFEADAGDLFGLTGALSTFYNDDISGASPASFMSPLIDRSANACRIDWYLRPAVAGPLGAPVASENFTLEGVGLGGGILPSEVALCLSFAGDTPAGASKGRWRGRVYIGPMASNAREDSVIHDRPIDAAMQALVQNANQLMETAAILTATWEVWSNADYAGHEVTHGWVDNAWDTQRRRGPAPTGRLVFP